MCRLWCGAHGAMMAQDDGPLQFSNFYLNLISGLMPCHLAFGRPCRALRGCGARKCPS